MRIVQKGSRRIIERGPKRSKRNLTKREAEELRKRREDEERKARQEGETRRAYEKRCKMCAGKKHFPSEEAAISAAAKNRTGKKWRWYRCPYCHGWHLTTH